MSVSKLSFWAELPIKEVKNVQQKMQYYYYIIVIRRNVSVACRLVWRHARFVRVCLWSASNLNFSVMLRTVRSQIQKNPVQRILAAETEWEKCVLAPSRSRELHVMIAVA